MRATVVRTRAAAAAAGLVLCLPGCATITDGLRSGPSFSSAPPDSASAGSAAPDTARVVVGENGLAAGIPAAIQVFGRYAEDEPAPTVLPRRAPSGAAFAGRVSIAPDGRRLAIARTASRLGRGFEIELVGIETKKVLSRHQLDGEFSYVGWADDERLIVGSRRGGVPVIETLSVVTSARRVLAAPGDGVLAIGADGTVVTSEPGRDRFACPSGVLPATYADVPIAQAGPPDGEGRIVFRTVGGGTLVPYDCEGAAFGRPIYEGERFTGALYDSALGGYYGVWAEDGARYFDPSLSYEMRTVAASFPSEASIWPVEFTRSPATALLYVSGADLTPSYYVLDRYAGTLDLQASDERQQ